MKEKLFHKRQRFDEAFESYAWDVYSMYQKLNPKIEKLDVVNRIINTCIPEPTILLTRANYAKVTDLIIDARQIIADINKLRGKEGKPFLRARHTDPVPESKQKFGKFQPQNKTFYNSSSNAGSSKQHTSSSNYNSESSSNNTISSASQQTNNSSQQAHSSSSANSLFS